MKNNLLNPTAGQIKHRNRLWANALRNNKRKAREKMKDCHGGRCCLRVAEDLAIEMGVDVPRRDEHMPHENVSRFFGWNHSENPNLVTPYGIQSATSLNDGDFELGVYFERSLSHKQIAECVENTFVHPSRKKWTTFKF